jgi:amino acid transporter
MYCLVSGGPYGLEPLIGSVGVSLGLVLILLIPIVWALPTALMTAELSAAIPEEGGYYIWVKRALGPFAGFMCAWLSWLYSLVDAALYPLLFAQYLGQNLEQLFGWSGGDTRLFLVAVALIHIIVITYLNLKGIQTVGWVATLLATLIIGPFAVFVLKAGISIENLPPMQFQSGDLAVGLGTVMWNYLGWDQLSTVTGEIERPQRSVPRALAIAIPLVTIVYLLPVLAGYRVAKNPAIWVDGSWPTIVTAAAGTKVGILVLLGGLCSASAMFVSQMLASSRIPAVLAQDGYLPKTLSEISPKWGTPAKSILFCAFLYTCLSWFSFSELITVNALLYGLSIVLEFAALIALRKKEPTLTRPFLIKGGLPILYLIAIPPILLTGLLAVVTVIEEGWLKQIVTLAAILVGVGFYMLRRPKTAIMN